ncbi:glycosyltransferase [Flexithrix dorotheae]|uniref:glycosyltransferase n=1 Tax=Flexithrix dorotheae TaxID=70993 RepID=UPI000370563A|nr:glycosyltransferase [Flexithrix dorotheae]
MTNFDQLPVVIQALPKWDAAYSSAACTIAKHFSKKRMVFYIEHPFTMKDVYSKKFKTQIDKRKKIWKDNTLCYERPFSDLQNFIAIYPRPGFPLNILPNSFVFNWLQKINEKRIWQQINPIFELFGVQEFIYINSFDPIFSGCYSNKKAALKIYHCVDNIAGEKYIAKHGIKAEVKVAKEFDMTISTSKALQQKMLSFNSNSYYVGNATNFLLFDKAASKPTKELSNIVGKKVIYTGNIGLRIDYELIRKSALINPDLQFIFIGPINHREFKGHKLEHIDNIHFLGPKPYEDLGKYLGEADVCIIPFLCNDLTKYIYPLKINEYWAAGKPVVTSRFADFGEHEKEIYTFKNAEEFGDAIRKAIKEDSTKKIASRKKIASVNTWENRILEFENLISIALKNKISTQNGTKIYNKRKSFFKENSAQNHYSKREKTA